MEAEASEALRPKEAGGAPASDGVPGDRSGPDSEAILDHSAGPGVNHGHWNGQEGMAVDTVAAQAMDQEAARLSPGYDAIEEVPAAAYSEHGEGGQAMMDTGEDAAATGGQAAAAVEEDFNPFSDDYPAAGGRAAGPGPGSGGIDMYGSAGGQGMGDVEGGAEEEEVSGGVDEWDEGEAGGEGEEPDDEGDAGGAMAAPVAGGFEQREQGSVPYSPSAAAAAADGQGLGNRGLVPYSPSAAAGARDAGAAPGAAAEGQPGAGGDQLTAGAAGADEAMMGAGEGQEAVDGAAEEHIDATAAAAGADAAYHHPHHMQQEEHDQVSKLNELEAFLRQPDAVMEPDILLRLREYVMAQGNPKQAVEHLTDSYVGYAQMSTLVCSWLKLTEDAAEPGPGSQQSALPLSQQRSAGGGGMDTPAAVASNAPASAVPASPAKQQAAAAAARVEMDEAYFLRSLAQERFNPERFAGIFSATGSGAPPWLSGLISEAEGRRLIYELSAKYKNSLLLNFAIQKILMQPGREAEVAAVGASLAAYFGVFHRLLAARLREAASTRDEARLAQLSAELAEGAAASQHAYLHAQQLLRAAVMPAEPDGLAPSEATADSRSGAGTAAAAAGVPRGAPRFLRLAQELEQAAAAQHGGVVWKMSAWMADPGGPPALWQPAAAIVADLLVGAGSSGSPPTSDLIRLYRLYFPPQQQQQQQHQAEAGGGPGSGALPLPPDAHAPAAAAPAAAADMPPVALLRQPRVFEVLLTGLFSPTRQLPAEAYAACSGLLSLAAAAMDTRFEPGTGQQRQQEQQQHPDAVTEGEPQANGGGGGGGSQAAGSSGSLDLSEVAATREALEMAADLARRTLQEHRSSPEDLEQAERVLEYPCCAAGVLHMFGAQLSSSDYWQSSYRLAKQPPFLALLSALVPAAPLLHSRLLSVVGAALRALGNSDHDLAKNLLEVTVDLVAVGRVVEVLRWAESWAAGGADPSLLRHLAFRILERAAPPYSEEFAGGMVRLMMAGGVRRARLGARDWGLRALLREFGSACAAVQFSPPLSAKESQFLHDISSDRPPGYS